ncbi:MAG: hypothetical protein ACFE8U_12500 [Candidatus Hermodarchaeota archaeon]
MTDLIRIRTEPCSVCNKTLPLSIEAEQLQPDITGLDLFLDLHGIDDEKRHARILYIDAKGFVRTISAVTKFTHVLHKQKSE